MASGKHTSVRVALAVPPKIHEQLAAWADYEGRPVASLCMYIVERGLREAQEKGIAPSFKERTEQVMTEFGPTYADEDKKIIAEGLIKDGRHEKYTKSFEEMTKKEKLMTAISEALFD